MIKMRSKEIFMKTIRYCQCILSGLFMLITASAFSQDKVINNPVKNFERLWKDFNDNYAFFELKNVDWSKTYQEFRPLVNERTTNDSLFTICCEMIRQLNDRHISLIAGPKKCDINSPVRLLEEFPTNSSLRLLAETIDSTLKRLQFNELKRVKMKIPYLSGNIIEYTVNDRYGYLRINLMIGISRGKLNKVMKDVVESFGDVEGIIIDVRFNSGGYDDFSYMIAGRFIDEKRVGHYKSTKTKRGFTALEARYLKPAGKKQIVKPVVLITSDQSMSATDVFALIMRQLPYVTIIGDNTKGIFSDVREWKLPNRWSYTFSSQKYLSADMKNYEGIGISPDIKVLNTIQDVKNGLDPVLLEAIRALDNKTK